jgi:predicted nucleotidyltransferase
MTRSELSFFFTNKFCDIKTEKDIAIRQRVEDHLIDAINNGMNLHNIVFIALEGSQNYGLDLPNSDVDTKLIVLPTLNDVIYGRRPISSTACRENNEHTNYIDIRNYFNILRNQNINFIEILFSPWILVNKEYEDEVNRLLTNRELIARYNEVKAVKTIAGIAKDRYKAIYNTHAQRADIINKYGYDGKAISHLIRIFDFLVKYTSYWSYTDCLHPDGKDMILKLKENTYFSKEEANQLAELNYQLIQINANNFITNHPININEEVDIILNDIQRDIIKKTLGIK